MPHITQMPDPKFAPKYPLALIRSIVAITICSFAIIGCGPNEAEPEVPVSIRAPRPTFTPTAATSAASNAPANSQNAAEPQVQVIESADGAENIDGTGGSVVDPAASANTATNSRPAAISSEAVQVESGGVAVVSIQLLNGRARPSAGSDLVGIVGKGEFFDIIGRSEAGDWWQVCCYVDTPFWVADEFVDIQGGKTQQAAAPPPTNTPVPPTAVPPTAAPPTVAPSTAAAQPTAPPAAPPTAPSQPAESNFNFALKASEQFPETNMPRIFLYAFQNDQALSGYSLKVTKDGAVLDVNATSFGPHAGFTWPMESARQRFQNMKAEFPGQSPSGTWILQLVDSGGNPVGPEATFNLSAGDENQEMYVRYEQQ